MDILWLARIFGSTIDTLSLFGLIANIIPISYFIKSEKKGFPNKLMICLNFTDLLTSLTLIISIIIKRVFNINELESETGNGTSVLFRNVAIVAITIFDTMVLISGCLTFFITLLRTIVIYNPFYWIKQKLCVSCLVIVDVVLVTLIQALTFWTSLLPNEFKPFGQNALIVASLACCNIVMSIATIIVIKKTGGDGHHERNYVAVTMVIISVIYSIASPGWLRFLFLMMVVTLILLKTAPILLCFLLAVC